jgi:hypothetical protein
MNEVHGFPTGTPSEFTTKTYWDTLTYDVGAVPARKKFFDSSAKDSQYRNFVLSPNASLTTEITIVGIHISHNFKFNVGANTGYEKAYQESFEILSSIYWEKESKGYPQIPLTDILNYQPYTNGGTGAQREKRTDYYPLLDPILIPRGGEIDFYFNPATGYTLNATAAGFLPGVTGTNFTTANLGFYIRMSLFAWVKRSAL